MSLETRNFFPALQRNVSPTTSGSQLVSYSSDLATGDPIVVLIHGYPQSAFAYVYLPNTSYRFVMLCCYTNTVFSFPSWRHIIPALAPKVSLFVPELPGYGISSMPTTTNDYSKKSVGTAILEALAAVFAVTADSPRKVIIGGHDRGARVCHRLAVDKADFLHSLGLDITATLLLDIVPTKVQWELFANPAIAQGYFHWPFLANVELATQVITAFGGGTWVRGGMRLAGNEEGLRRVTADGAVDVYAGLFEKEETIRGSCEDYKAGATREFDEQAEDQKSGRKIEVPVLVMFSNVGIGSKSDVPATWAGWVKEGTPLETVGVDGYGHYLPEEAHDIVSAKVVEFLDKYA